MTIKLAIADDHPMIIQGLIGILQPHSHLELIGTYGTGTLLLRGLTQQVPDVLLLDCLFQLKRVPVFHFKSIPF